MSTTFAQNDIRYKTGFTVLFYISNTLETLQPFHWLNGLKSNGLKYLISSKAKNDLTYIEK